jgi:hypothetical protein
MNHLPTNALVRKRNTITIVMTRSQKARSSQSETVKNL